MIIKVRVKALDFFPLFFSCHIQVIFLVKSGIDVASPFFLVTCLFQSRRGEQQEVLYIDESRVMLKYLLPLSEIIVDFYDELKSQSSGYARFVF